MSHHIQGASKAAIDELLVDYVVRYEAESGESMGLYCDMAATRWTRDHEVETRFFRSLSDFLMRLPSARRRAPLGLLSDAYTEYLRGGARCPVGSPARSSYELAARYRKIEVTDDLPAEDREMIRNALSSIADAIGAGMLVKEEHLYRRLLILLGRPYTHAKYLGYKIAGGLAGIDSSHPRHLTFPRDLGGFISILHEVMMIEVPAKYVKQWRSLMDRVLAVAFERSLNPVRLYYLEKTLARILLYGDIFEERARGGVKRDQKVRGRSPSIAIRMKRMFEEMLGMLEDPELAASMDIAARLFPRDPAEAIAVFETILERRAQGGGSGPRGGQQSSPAGSAPPLPSPAGLPPLQGAVEVGGLLEEEGIPFVPSAHYRNGIAGRMVGGAVRMFRMPAMVNNMTTFSMRNYAGTW